SDVAQRGELAHGRIVLERSGQLGEQLLERTATFKKVPDVGDVEERLACKSNVLLPAKHLVDIPGQFPLRHENVHLDDERAHPRQIIQHIQHRRIAHDAAVPVVLAVDHHRRKAGRQGTTGAYVVGAYAALQIVKVEGVARADVNYAQRK